MDTSNKNVDIIAFGDSNDYRRMFEILNNQFTTNETYKNKPNQIKFNLKTTNNENLFEMNITTKYYDSELIIETFSFDELETELDKNNQGSNKDGVFILVSQNTDIELLLNSKTSCEFFKSKENALNILIRNDSNKINQEKVESFLYKFENFIEIKLELNQNKFERKDDSENDDETDFTSLDELINLFFVHTWSNMRLKSGKVSNNQETLTVQNVTDKKEDNADVLDPIIDEENNIDDEDEFSFENLLMNLNEMKMKASNLSFEERKKYAETVVKNFWQSMGGDQSEIGDLDQD
jgi:hypothetical protein